MWQATYVGYVRVLFGHALLSWFLYKWYRVTVVFILYIIISLAEFLVIDMPHTIYCRSIHIY